MERNGVTYNNTYATELIITNHGRKRMRERCGLNKKSVERIAEKAFTEGLTTDQVKGALKKWCVEHEKQEDAQVKVYGNFLYIFRENRLITLLNIPSKFNKLTNVSRHACRIS